MQIEYPPADNSLLIFSFVVFLVGFVMWKLLCFVGRSAAAVFETTPTPSRTPQDLAQDAAWYRAEKLRLEALTEYEIKRAELEDTRRFLKTRKP